MMTNKAYIVANEQQEREVLEKLERDGFKWRSGKTPTENSYLMKEPITFFVGDDKQLTFDHEVTDVYLAECEIVFDGRKEEKMSEKYVVSQEFMDELEDWRYVKTFFISSIEISTLPEVVKQWRHIGDVKERNNRLIAIIRWVNGEDMFEVEKPKKWIVRSKDTDVQGDHWYVYAYNTITSNRFTKADATRFNSKEEAESWANSHQEVVEVEE